MKQQQAWLTAREEVIENAEIAVIAIVPRRVGDEFVSSRIFVMSRRLIVAC